MQTPRVRRPRIYGSDTRCRAALARYISRGDELLDEAVGVRNRLRAWDELADASAMADGYLAQKEWGDDFRKWMAQGRRAMSGYLQEQLFDVLPVLARGLPPETGKPRHTITLDNGEPWLRNAVEQLRDMQAALGVKRDVANAAPAPARFAELHASGLVDAKVISDHAKDMLAPRTPRQLYNAIGSAKELTEATLRAALGQLGESYDRGDDLPALMKKWRSAIGHLAPPDPQGAQSLDRAQASLANLVTFLAEWRNSYGRGHGRPKYPPGLTSRHARLAADAAETSVRFIVTTMDDLQVLPPLAAIEVT